MAFGRCQESTCLLLGEDVEFLCLHLGALHGIHRIVPDQPFLDRLPESAVQGRMDQLDDAGASAFRLRSQVQLEDVGGLDVLEPYFPYHGQDMLFGVAAVVVGRVRPDGKVFAGEPALHVAFQGELRHIEGHSMLDLISDLPDPVLAFSLRLGILGDAPAAQADLGTPTSILPLE